MLDYHELFDAKGEKVYEDILSILKPYHVLSIRYELGDGMYNIKAYKFEIRFSKTFSLSESVTVTVDFDKKETVIANGTSLTKVWTGASDGICIGCLAAYMYEYWFGGKNGSSVED